MKRRHNAHSLLQPWLDADELRENVRACALAAARYEPALRQMDVSGAIDLVFERAGSIAVVPLVMLDCAMLAEPEDDALLWPPCVAEGVPESELDAISDLVLPWLRACAMSAGLNSERIRIFGGSEFAGLFQRARGYGFLGAAPYERVVRDAASCAYALRFADGCETAGVRYAGGSAGAAMLSSAGIAVRADLGNAERNALASRWYARDIYGPIAPGQKFDLFAGDASCAGTRATVRTGEVPEGFHAVAVPAPVPFSVLFSFDEDDGPAVETFGVHVAERALPRRPRFGQSPDPVGGSAGRILIGVRKDALGSPDADTDDAHELARRLRAEGFTVDVRSHLCDADPHDYDLVHAFGLIAAEDVQYFLQRARDAHRPAVLTPALEDVTLRGVWGAGVSQFVLSMTCDERDLETYLHHLARHNLSTPALASNARHEPRPGFDQAVRGALAAADAVLVSGTAEEALLRRYGYAGSTTGTAAYLNTGAPAVAADECAGLGDYILCHASIEPRGNQALLVRAARQARLPIVFAGPVADASYFELVREHAGENVRFVPEPDAGQAAALYGNARVFADAAWIGYGLRRIAQAAAYGCALAVANLRYAGGLWRPGLFEMEPASVPSMAQALRDAWNAPAQGLWECAARVAAQCDPAIALVATVSAYAQAQAGRLNSAAAAADI